MAVKVTDILKQILVDQGKRTIDGQTAVRRILEETRKQVVGEIASQPAGSFAGYRQQQMLAQIDRLLATAGNSIQSEVSGLITDQWDLGRTMLPEMARAGSDVTLTTFGVSNHVMDQIRDFAWGKVSGVTNDAQAKIRAEMSLGLLGQQSPQEVAAGIAGAIEGKPSIFKSVTERAETITKTEGGRALSMATQASLDNAMDTLAELLKMWLHAGHPKSPRIPHLNLDGDAKPVNEPFLVGNIAMMYPRDPSAPASEIINCGCVHVPYMAAWGTKKQFLQSWQEAQRAANKPREA